MSPTAEVHAAVGVLTRGCGKTRQVLLARRAPGRVYAGYWEFPGGKIEAGETPQVALLRELREELNITAVSLRPWLKRIHHYPHARVHLYVQRVDAWYGDFKPTAHDQWQWLAADESPPTPMLPANGPVLRALLLPEQMLISAAESHGVAAECQRLRQALAGGLNWLLLRDKTMTKQSRRAWAIKARSLTRQYAARLLIHDDLELAVEVEADGLHLSQATLNAQAERPSGLSWVGASVHDADSLRRAEALALDYALLGSILPTTSHPHAKPLGWAAMSALCANAAIPVVALGGMRPGLLPLAQQLGAHGIACRSQWFR